MKNLISHLVLLWHEVPNEQITSLVRVGSLPIPADSISSPYGQFPQPDDVFQFIPCSGNEHLPSLDDATPRHTWSEQFNPDPESWNWGNVTWKTESAGLLEDPHAVHGIYLCGWLDVPLDYTNTSDGRIARLAVTKYQVSGLAYRGSEQSAHPSTGQKSNRTLVINPGGPGGSGTAQAWRNGQLISERLSLGQFDVLGWDPRGVNASLPRASCYPFDADRDRWSLLTGQYRETVSSPEAQLNLADAMNDATFNACNATLGDLPRFVSTAFVARDIDRILTALGESELSGYFVSYGTGLGQTFANMFPNRVGHLILDGTQYVRDQRMLGGVGWTSLDNGTDAWKDGFIGECIAAGPDHCALARLTNDKGAYLSSAELRQRMADLLASLITRPRPAFLHSTGPSILTYSQVVHQIYQTLYTPQKWPQLARALYDLDQGDTDAMAMLLDEEDWEYHPAEPLPFPSPSSDELGTLVVCADCYDAPKPWFKYEDDDTDWWLRLWQNMTAQSWVAGNDRFYMVLPCRHYTRYFGSAAEVYRGDLNHTLSNPVLLIAETYDPATPLRNGRRLLAEMGDNARLIVHHGYGHASRDSSNCTDQIARAYILDRRLPESSETDCFADGKPYQMVLPEV